MDINRLIDFYDKEQKTVFTAFIVNLPLGYAFLNLHMQSFSELDSITKVVYAISLSIAVTFAAFLVQLIVVVPTIRLIRLFQLLCPSISAFAFYACFHTSPLLTYIVALACTALGGCTFVALVRRQERRGIDKQGKND